MRYKALMLLLALSTGAAMAGPSLESQVDAVFAEYARPGSPGAAVGIYKSGQLVLAKGYGTADLESGAPLTPRTRFHMASVSKQFTGFAIALLARDGKLELDADVHRYLPYLPDFGHPITVRQLLQHTSGLRDQWILFQLGGKDMRDVLRQEQAVSMVKRQRRLNFVPGTQYSYSNTGYTLLAEIVRAVSGMTLREFTTERIFTPLGMHDTFFYDDVREIVPGRANSYEQVKNGPWMRSLLNYQTVGATGLLTTIEDLARWAGNFSKHRGGDAKLIDLITRSGTLNDGTSIHYGFGLSDVPQDGRKAISHGGSDASFATLLVIYPEYDVAIAVLANRDMDTNAKLHAVANLYLPPVEAAAKAKAPGLLGTPDPRLLSALVGTYVYPIYPALKIERRDSGLFACSGVQESKALVFRKDGSFDLGSRERSYFRPVVTKGGVVTAVDNIFVTGLPSERYERIALVTDTPQALAAHAGDYHSDELDITYSLGVEDGNLVARTLWGAEPIRLVQITADHFDTDRSVPNVFTFVRDAKGQVSGALIQANRAYNTELHRVTPVVN